MNPENEARAKALLNQLTSSQVTAKEIKMIERKLAVLKDQE